MKKREKETDRDYPFCGPEYMLIRKLDNCKPPVFSELYYEPPSWCPFALEHVVTKGKKHA